MSNFSADTYKSANRASDSGTMFRAISYTNGEYVPISPTNAFRGFICATAGNVNIVGLDGTSCILPAMAAGVVHPCAGQKILQASTVATGIIAVF